MDDLFKPLDPACEATVLPVSLSRISQRLQKRKPGVASGLSVETDTLFALGTMVEVRMVFPGKNVIYSALGRVEWQQESGIPTKPHRLGIRIASMERSGEENPPTETNQESAERAYAPTVASSPARTAQILNDTAPIPETANANPNDIIEEHTAEKPDEQLAENPEVQPEEQPEEQLEEQPVEEPIAQRPQIELPSGVELSETLRNLLGTDVPVEVTPSLLPQDKVAALGTYVSDSGEVLAVGGMDLELATWIGSALAMIPNAEAKDIIESGALTEVIRENVQEIWNILSSLLSNHSGNAHVRSGAFFDTQAGLSSEDCRKLCENSLDRVEFIAEVSGRGSGRMFFLTPPPPK